MKSGSHFHLIVKLISDTLRLHSKGTMEFCQERGNFSSISNCYISVIIQSLVGTVRHCAYIFIPSTLKGYNQLISILNVYHSLLITSIKDCLVNLSKEFAVLSKQTRDVDLRKKRTT